MTFASDSQRKAMFARIRSKSPSRKTAALVGAGALAGRLVAPKVRGGLYYGGSKLHLQGYKLLRMADSMVQGTPMPMAIAPGVRRLQRMGKIQMSLGRGMTKAALRAPVTSSLIAGGALVGYALSRRKRKAS